MVQVIYKIVCQRLPRTSLIQNRVTESCWDKPLLFAKNESNFIFSLKTQAENDSHSSTVAVWFPALYNIPPKPGYAVRQSFSFTSDVWPKWAVQPKESGAVRKEQVFQTMLAPLWPGPVKLALFKTKSHAFKACFYLDNLKVVSLGNILDQRVIGAYFYWESPYILPKGVCTSCVARKQHHVCL